MLSPEAWAQMRHDYEHTDKPIHEICAEHGISTGTLRDRMRRWGWARRRPPIPPDGPPPLPAPRVELVPPAALRPASMVAEPLAEPVEADAQNAATPAPCAAPQAAAFELPPIEASPALIAQRLQGAVARVLPAIETTLGRLAAGPTRPREMEHAARTLGALTRTLRELSALLAEHPPAQDDGPDNLDDFRRELVRKMDMIIAEGPTDGGDNDAPP